jgi:hypothetical protein
MEFIKQGDKVICREEVEFSQEQILNDIGSIESALISLESEKERLNLKLAKLKALNIKEEKPQIEKK